MAEEPAVRSTEDGLRLSCDICRTSIFDEYFTCSCCGSDFCPSCLALSLRQERGFERKFTFVEFGENCGGDKCSDGSSGMHNTKHFVHLLERKKLPHSMWEEKLLRETEVLASCRKQLHKQYLMQDTSTTTSNECCPWCPYLSTDEVRSIEPSNVTLLSLRASLSSGCRRGLRHAMLAKMTVSGRQMRVLLTAISYRWRRMMRSLLTSSGIWFAGIPSLCAMSKVGCRGTIKS